MPNEVSMLKVTIDEHFLSKWLAMDLNWSFIAEPRYVNMLLSGKACNAKRI